MTITTYALIKNGVVTNIVEQDSSTPPPVEFNPVLANPNVQVGWSYVAGIFAPLQFPALTAAQILVDFQQSAQAALSATDATFTRIQEAITLGLVPATDASVVSWIEYRKSLRAEINAAAVGTLAVKPAIYPAGT